MSWVGIDVGFVIARESLPSDIIFNGHHDLPTMTEGATSKLNA